MTTSSSCRGSACAPVPPRRIRKGLLFHPREMVLGRPPQQRRRGQPDQGPAPGPWANFAKDRKGGGYGPDMEQRVVRRKTRRWKTLRLGEDWYSQLVVPPGPKAVVDECARQGRPGKGREERVPPCVVPFRGEADPRRDCGPPESTSKPESEFRLQHETNPTGQLESVMRRGQHRGRHGARPPHFHPTMPTRHGCHLIRRRKS
jgi:hypothetical protein